MKRISKAVLILVRGREEDDRGVRLSFWLGFGRVVETFWGQFFWTFGSLWLASLKFLE